MRQLLLLSNSRDADGNYLVHARDALAEHLNGVRSLVFVPYAAVGFSWDDYATMVRDAFSPLGVSVRSLHEVADAAALVDSADAIAVGGGNTFHLLATLQRTGLLAPVCAAALAGVPYIGWSAGSVIACPTLGTTNDMPIVAPASFAALDLVRFQINAHFTDAHPPGFRGETRRERLREYVAVNGRVPVIGLPEGDWLQVNGVSITLHGAHPAVLFRGGMSEAECAPGASLESLLEPPHDE